MPKDLRATQLRTGQLVATGSSGTVPLVFIRDSVANGNGGVTAGVLAGAGTDVFLFVSGAISGRGVATNGVAAFGGDVVISGTIYDSSGNAYTTTAASAGPAYFSSTTNGSIFTTGSAAFRGSESSVDSPNDKGTDVFFYVSGTRGGPRASSKKSLFGGDQVVSGTIYASNFSSEALSVSGTFYHIVGEVSNAFVIKDASSIGASSENAFAVDNDSKSIGFWSTPTKRFEVGGINASDDMVMFLSGTGGASSADPKNFSDVNFYVSGSRGTVTQKGSKFALFDGDLATSGSILLLGTGGFGLVTLTGNDLTVRNRVLGGTFVAGVNTSAGNTVNFLDVRPNGAATNTKISFMQGVYAGPANPFNASDTNFFVGGSAGSRGGTTGGTSVFGGDLFISGSSYIGNSSSNKLYVNAELSTDIIPDGNRTRNLGSDTRRFANIFTGDLHLRNERGDWTIVEEPDFLCVRNNRTGKSFKMMLEPIVDSIVSDS